jgi:hypothetical protein
MHSILELLLKEGFITFSDDTNLVEADKAFLGARIIEWIREHAQDPDFELQPYLVALTYYKLGLAEIKFEDDELLYRYTGGDMGELIDEMAETDSQPTGGFYRPSDFETFRQHPADPAEEPPGYPDD